MDEVNWAGRERALKVVLVVMGLLLCAGVYPLRMFFSREPAVPMITSIYVTLGIFLLLAVRNPAANRSLIAFGECANLAHAGVMAVREYRNVIERRELAGAVVFAIVGVVLVALAPAKQSTEGIGCDCVGERAAYSPSSLAPVKVVPLPKHEMRPHATAPSRGHKSS